MREKKNEEEEEELPERLHMDLLFEILLRLDVKSLCRCRCICQKWNETISSPPFVTMHRRRSMSRNNYLLFVSTHRDSPHDVWTFTMADPNQMDEEGRWSARAFIGTCSTDSRRIGKRYCVEFPLVCCDLLCFHASMDIFLCNPRTGRVEILPRPPGREDCEYGSIVDVTLGYNAYKREYVVLITRFVRDSGQIAHKLWFSDDSGSSTTTSSSSSNISSSSSLEWKEIEKGFPRMVQRDEGILINNLMYFMIWRRSAIDENRNDELLLSLDLDKDEFGIINGPPNPSWKDDLDPEINMIDLKGELCLAHFYGRIDGLEIWAFKSHSCSWVKAYQIQPFGSPFPKRFWVGTPWIYPKSSSEGELIMQSSDSKFKYYLYNPEKKSLRIARHPRPAASSKRKVEEFKPMFACFLWESFFSFAGFD